MSKARRDKPLGRSAARFAAGVDPAARPHRVARQVIRGAADDLIDRLRDLPEPDPRRPDRSEADQQAVHQVRVSTRRLTAALAAFAPLLRDKRRRRLSRAARRVRRAGAEVRELDILQRLVDRAWNAPHPAAPGPAQAVAQRVRDLITSRRDEARLRFARTGSRRSIDRLQLRADRACAALESIEQHQSLAEAAPRLLEPIVKTFAGCLPPELPTIDQLHTLRLAVKKARYAIEVLQPALDTPRCIAAHQRLVELQDRLGDLNDLHRGAELLRAIMVDEFAMRWCPGDDAPSPGGLDATDVAALLECERLSNVLRTEAAARADGFVSWWRSAGREWVMRPLQSLCADGEDPGECPAVRVGHGTEGRADTADPLASTLDVVIAASHKAARNGVSHHAPQGAPAAGGHDA